ncbi:carbohydrate ABC transporter permease [Kitasatospora albolonga]|uniref:Carbohydrate ABC transporter permease n=3 Tax=Streptomyces TaxID=1883 RepID=A0ABU2WDX3_9ACTN|nr:carbohydrate ABC transporter permease [Streptomyces griseus]MDT0495282.1 carbohydrate ABC transporter permease [Streptomyces griseus]
MSTQTATPDAPPAPTPRTGTGRRPSPPPARRTRGLTSRVMVNGVLAVVAVYTLMPLTWLLIAATKNYRDLFATNPFSLGDFHLLSNLDALFAYNDGLYGRWLLNSLLYTLVAAVLSTLVSVACGYAFDKYAFRGKEKLFGVVLVGVLIPSTVVQLPLYLMASRLGLVDTYWAVLIPSLVNPFGVYLARVFSEGYVPGEVLEAARVDGAGELQTFTKVALPMLAPGFVTIFLFSFTANWNNFYGALMMLNDERLYPVNLGLFMWNQNVYQQPELYPLVIIGSLVAVVPLIVAFLCLQRFWRSGLTAGAVK